MLMNNMNNLVSPWRKERNNEYPNFESTLFQLNF